MEIEKVFGKISTESENFFENRGEIWNRGECIMVSGGDGRPWQ